MAYELNEVPILSVYDDFGREIPIPAIRGEQGPKGEPGKDGTTAVDETLTKPTYAADAKQVGDDLRRIAAQNWDSYPEGEAIAVDDVSPLEHSVGCKVVPLNLFNAKLFAEKITEAGGSGNENDEWKGESCLGYNLNPAKNAIFTGFEENTQYTLNVDAAFNVSSPGFVQFMNIDYTDGTTSPLFFRNASGEFQNFQITSLKGKTISKICVLVFGPTRAYLKKSTLTLSKGTETLPFVPYIPDLSKVTVSRYGKNLIKVSISGGTIMGAHYEITPQGKIKLSGTTSSSDSWKIAETKVLPPGRYKASGCPTEGQSKNYRLIIKYGKSSTTTDRGQGAEFEMTEPFAISMDVFLPEALDTNGIVFSPLICRNDFDNDFVPYVAPQTCTPSPSGTVSGMTSLSPNMTILTDTPGALIKLSYASSEPVKEKKANQEFASSIKVQKSGEVITADDVSPLEHGVGCKVSSKNMTTAMQVYEKASDYALATEDGRNTVTFRSSSTRESSFTNFKPNTQYTVSFEAKVVNGSGGTSLFAFFYTDGTYSNLVKGSSDWEKATLTSTPGKTVSGIGVSSYNYRETNYIDIDTFQLEEGVKATPYVPYIPDLSAVAIKRIGSNRYEMGTKADYLDNDGTSIEIVGNSITGRSVPSAMGFIVKETFFEPGIFHLSAVFERGCAFIVRCFDEGGNLLSGSDVSLPEGIYNNYYKGWKMSGASIAIKFPSKVKKWKLGFVFTGDTAYERLTIRDIMVNTGSEALPFAPYQEQTYTPSSSGVVSGMTSLSPNMTILTNTSKALLDVTYNVDTKTYIDNKFAELKTAILSQRDSV